MTRYKPRYIIPKRKIKYPIGIERDFARTLRSVAITLNAVTIDKIDIIKSFIKSRTDETNSEYILRLIKETYIATGHMGRVLFKAQNLIRQVNEYNEKELYAALRSVFKIDIFINSPDLRNLVEEQTVECVRLIKTIPEQYFNQLQGIVSRGLTQGALNKEISEEIQNLYGVTSRRAQVIARDQIGSLNGLISEQRQTAAGIGVYEWSSSKDSRVRPEHADREGKYYAWPGSGMVGKEINGKKVLQLPPGAKAPGLEILCRCVALPIIDSEMIQGGVRL